MSNPSLSQGSTDVEYALGHSSRELDRLSFQGNVLGPYTRDFLVRAGLKEGMRVLDVGSGGGDVSFLAAELVGPEGSVLGVDRSAEAVERARTRAIRCHIHGEDGPMKTSAKTMSQVAFAVGDPASMHFDRPFDAIIGRFARTQVPCSWKLKIASAAEVQIDDLADRMREEVVAKRGVAMSYGLVGAWARKPFTQETEER